MKKPKSFRKEIGPETDDMLYALERCLKRLKDFIEFESPAQFIDKEIQIICRRAIAVASAIEIDADNERLLKAVFPKRKSRK